MNIFFILSLTGWIFFSICLSLLIVKFNIPPSLSESYYNLGGSKKYGALFYLMLAITAFLMVIPMVEAMGIWGFFISAGLLFVGAAPAFRSKSEHWIHVIGALTAAISSILGLLFLNKIIIIFIVFAVILVLAFLTNTYKTSGIFWLEMIAFYSIFIGMMFFFI